MRLDEGLLLDPLKALFWLGLIEMEEGGRAQVWKGQRVLGGKEASVRGASGWGRGPRALSLPLNPQHTT